jgi:hypothetical protein
VRHSARGYQAPPRPPATRPSVAHLV